MWGFSILCLPESGLQASREGRKVVGPASAASCPCLCLPGLLVVWEWSPWDASQGTSLGEWGRAGSSHSLTSAALISDPPECTFQWVSSVGVRGQWSGVRGVPWAICRELLSGVGKAGSAGLREKTVEFSSAADFTRCPESDFGHKPLIWGWDPCPPPGLWRQEVAAALTDRKSVV